MKNLFKYLLTLLLILICIQASAQFNVTTHNEVQTDSLAPKNGDEIYVKKKSIIDTAEFKRIYLPFDFADSSGIYINSKSDSTKILTWLKNHLQIDSTGSWRTKSDFPILKSNLTITHNGVAFSGSNSFTVISQEGGVGAGGLGIHSNQSNLNWFDPSVNAIFTILDENGISFFNEVTEETPFMSDPLSQITYTAPTDNHLLTVGIANSTYAPIGVSSIDSVRVYDSLSVHRDSINDISSFAHGLSQDFWDLNNNFTVDMDTVTYSDSLKFMHSSGNTFLTLFPEKFILRTYEATVGPPSKIDVTGQQGLQIRHFVEQDAGAYGMDIEHNGGAGDFNIRSSNFGGDLVIKQDSSKFTGFDGGNLIFKNEYVDHDILIDAASGEGAQYVSEPTSYQSLTLTPFTYVNDNFIKNSGTNTLSDGITFSASGSVQFAGAGMYTFSNGSRSFQVLNDAGNDVIKLTAGTTNDAYLTFEQTVLDTSFSIGVDQAKKELVVENEGGALGNIQVASPTADDHATTKAYVDNLPSASLTDGAPTDAELDGVFSSPETGHIYKVKDSDGTGLVYIAIYDGTNWYTFAGLLAS